MTRGSYDLGKVYESVTRTAYGFSYDIGLFRNAYELLDRTIDNRSIGLVQGPPGTGKTTLLGSIINERVKNDAIDHDELFLIIAPTNDLVVDISRRIFSSYYSLYGTSSKTRILEEVRVYGSRLSARDKPEFKKLFESVDRDVKIVITTSYQMPYIRGESKNTVHLLIDEAGASPVHKSFIPSTNILRSIERGEDLDIGSFSLVGDPMQAISLGGLDPSDKNRILIMTNVIRGLLDIQGSSSDPSLTSLYMLLKTAYERLRGRFLEMLYTTQRLPMPSEEPISHAYYFDQLKSRREPIMDPLRDCGEKILKNLLNNTRQDSGFESKLNRVARGIDDALYSDNGHIKPIIYVETALEKSAGLSYDDVDLNLNINRAIISSIYAALLKAITGLGVTVLSPYVDQTIQTRNMIFWRIAGKIIDYIPLDCRKYFEIQLRRVNFTTVHKFLGKEDDIIIATLGKEYKSKSRSPFMDTIYFSQPEILNVQFTRHRKLLVIVGNLPRLYKYTKDAKEGDTHFPIKKFLEKFEEISGLEFKGRPLKSVEFETDSSECLVFDQWEIR